MASDGSPTGMVPPVETDGFAAPLILVVEDQAETRVWLEAVVRQAFPLSEIVALARLGDANQWLTANADLARARLRLALIDLGLPDGSGVKLIARLTEGFPDALPVVATVYDDDSYLFDAIAAGAQGYLLKDQDAALLVSRLKRIRDGEPPLSPSVARRMINHFRALPPALPVNAAAAAQGEAALTPRELEVLALLGRGSRAPEVALRLGLTEHTVSTYVKIIYRKLRISSRAEAALEASRRGLL